MALHRSKIRLAIAGLVGTLGVLVVAFDLPPYVHWANAREHSDIERSLTPLVNIPTLELAPDSDRAVDFVVPDDPQWRRIRRRMGSPEFLLLVASDPQSSRRLAYSATGAGLVARGTLDGQRLPLILTTDGAYGYSSDTDQTAYKFTARPSDTVRFLIRMSGHVAGDARVMVFPHWSGLEMWDWADSASMGEGFSDLLSPFFEAFGLLLVLIAIRIGREPKSTQ